MTIFKTRKMNLKNIFSPLLAVGFVMLAAQANAQEAAEGGSAVVSDIVLLYAMVGVAVLLAIANFVLLGTIKGFAADKKIWEVVKERNAKVTKGGAAALMVGLLLSVAPSAMAQEAAAVAQSEFVMGSDLFYALLAMNLILLFLVFYQVNVLRSLIAMIKGETEEETETVVDTWAAALTDVVPIEREEEIMFEHEHDGIRELDNNLPPWWLWGFYFTIAFGPFYIAYYHFMDGPSSHQEWVTQMEQAEEAKAAYLAGMSNLIDENNVEASMDESSLAEGKQIWIDNCAACHGANGEGGVGPNMTDKFWIHGGGIKNVFKTIKYGVPAKGMIPWEAQLSPGQMKNVASYILSLEGTNPAGAKEPQGDVWQEEAAAPAADAAPADSSMANEASAPDDGAPAEEPENEKTEQ